MGVYAPGSKRQPDADRVEYKKDDLLGVAALYQVVKHGVTKTKFDDESAFVDVLVTPLEGIYDKEQRPSRLFGGYLTRDFSGFEAGDTMLGRMQQGAPREGLRPGWFLVSVEDAKLQAAAEKLAA